ncbi:MAG: type IV pilin protein [Cocleimonas sp.]|nr:type IV pilin protein [Cocleimonas sp.]
MDAKKELLKIAQLQESYFAQNLSYANSLTQLGFTDDPLPSEDEYYNLVVFSATPDNCNTAGNPACLTYEVSARPEETKAQSGDSICTEFRFDNVSRKFAIGSGSTTWGTTTAAEKAKIDECWGK